MRNLFRGTAVIDRPSCSVSTPFMSKSSICRMNCAKKATFWIHGKFLASRHLACPGKIRTWIEASVLLQYQNEALSAARGHLSANFGLQLRAHVPQQLLTHHLGSFWRGSALPQTTEHGASSIAPRLPGDILGLVPVLEEEASKPSPQVLWQALLLRGIGMT